MSIQSQFPIFQHHPNLIYLDNAATSQKPKDVLNTITNFYTYSNANIGRGSYPLAAQAEVEYEDARATIAQFISALPSEIIFTQGCTGGINLLANILEINSYIKNGDEITVTEMEHHSNFLPWQELAKRTGAKLTIWPVNSHGELELDWLEKNINPKTALVSVTHISNSTGVVNEIQKIANIAHQNNTKTLFTKTLFLVDGAQAVAHHSVNVEHLDADFYVFSAHKMYGPTGVGVLFGKQKLLTQLSPSTFGGGAINLVTLSETEFRSSPYKFEPGTPNLAGVIGLAAAVNWLNNLNFNREQYISELTQYTIESMKKIANIEIVGNSEKNHSGIISFVPQKMHPLDLGTLLGIKNIAIRTGSHCTQPLMQKLKYENGTCRISLGLYNSKQDIDRVMKEVDQLLFAMD